MRLQDVMSVEPLTVGSDVPAEVAKALMDEGRVHHLPIVDEGHLVGMWVATDDGTPPTRDTFGMGPGCPCCSGAPNPE
mgnify:CR=1 FL=1